MNRRPMPLLDMVVAAAALATLFAPLDGWAAFAPIAAGASYAIARLTPWALDRALPRHEETES